MKKIGQALAKAGAAVPLIIRDLAGIAAVGLISYGSWLIYTPAGYIVAGVLILAGVVLVSAKSD